MDKCLFVIITKFSYRSEFETIWKIRKIILEIDRDHLYKYKAQIENRMCTDTINRNGGGPPKIFNVSAGGGAPAKITILFLISFLF